MFGRKKDTPTFDITQKYKKTWWGGERLVPTAKSEQKQMRAEILKRYPDAIIIDSEAKLGKELDWIDRIEKFDAFMDD